MSTESAQDKAARKAAENMAHVAAHSAAKTRARVKGASHHPDDKAAVDHSSGKDESQPHRSKQELRQSAQAARAELASTLDAIEFKLNVPKQVRLKTRRANDKLKRLGEDNPPALIAIALGAASVVGTAVWLGVRAIQRR